MRQSIEPSAQAAQGAGGAPRGETRKRRKNDYEKGRRARFLAGMADLQRALIDRGVPRESLSTQLSVIEHAATQLRGNAGPPQVRPQLRSRAQGLLRSEAQGALRSAFARPWHCDARVPRIARRRWRWRDDRGRGGTGSGRVRSALCESAAKLPSCSNS